MKERLKFAVIGGDGRNLAAAQIFMNQGWDTTLYGVLTEKSNIPMASDFRTAVETADVVLLPLPLTKDGVSVYAPALSEAIPISDLLSHVNKDAFLFGGACDTISDQRVIDYAKREDFALLNAVPTAEGAFLLALQHRKQTVFGSRVGILGFGRVAARTATLFHAAGADISVFARKAEARASAKLQGYHAYDFKSLKKEACTWDLVINTVPARLLGFDILQEMRKECLILDLASAPFGLDFNEAKEIGFCAICASALPGKYFPESAGKMIADTIIEILKEKSILF